MPSHAPSRGAASDGGQLRAPKATPSGMCPAEGGDEPQDSAPAESCLASTVSEERSSPRARCRRDGHRDERGIGSAVPRRTPARSRATSTLSATITPPGSSFCPRELEVRLVVVLPGVDEHDVEALLERRELASASPSSISAHSSRPASAMFRLPRLDLARVELERHDPPAEDARRGGQPDRRVAARAADLENLAAGVGRDEREQESARLRPDGQRALGVRHIVLTLPPSSSSRRASTARTRSSSTEPTLPPCVTHPDRTA